MKTLSCTKSGTRISGAAVLFAAVAVFSLMACATGPKTATLSKIVTHETAEGIQVIEKHYEVVK